MSVLTKICGLTTPDAVAAAVEHHAAYVGFVFYPPSPRHITPEAAGKLAEAIPSRVVKVAVTVNPSHDDIAAILDHFPLDYLQLHGSETPAQVDAIKLAFGIPVIKAVAVSTQSEIERAVTDYQDVANILMFDAKPPTGSQLPGGNGISFDWRLLHNIAFDIPVMLSGGLNAANVGQAVAQSGVRIVDVSSGVESAPGVKDVDKIVNFLRVTQGL